MFVKAASGQAPLKQHIIINRNAIWGNVINEHLCRYVKGLDKPAYLIVVLG